MITGADMMVSPVETRLGRTQSIYCNVINIENVNGVGSLGNGVTGFSGADMLVKVDGEMIGEIQEVLYDEDLHSGRIMGHIIAVMFDKDIEVRNKIVAAKTILMSFTSEEGKKKEEELTGVEVHTVSRKRNVGDTHFTSVYQFVAEFMEEGVPA